jgi:hypothetical protein
MTSENDHGIGGTAALFDYTTDAELYVSKFSRRGRHHLIYRRFASAAEAIRFAIEDLPAHSLVGTYLEVDETRFPSAEIRQLYASTYYPFARRVVVRPHDRAQRDRHLQQIIPAQRRRSNSSRGELSGRDRWGIIEGISLPAYRRVSTMIFVPGARGGSIEMVTIDPLDLRIALDQDTARL